MPLSAAAIDEYVADLTPEQAECIRGLRSLILKYGPDLVEVVDDGKWWRGLLTFTHPSGVFLYALGPRSGGKTTLHLMTYYANKAMQEKHGPGLKKFLTGKSCMQFKQLSDVPMDALRDIMGDEKAVNAVVEAILARQAK